MFEGLFLSPWSFQLFDIHYEELRLQPTLSVIRSEIMFLIHDLNIVWSVEVWQYFLEY